MQGGTSVAYDSGVELQAEVKPAAEFDMEFVPELPNGRAIFPAERNGKFGYLVATGAMTEQCLTELVRHIRSIVRSGSWQQNWREEPSAQQCPAASEHANESVFDMEWRNDLPGGAAVRPDESQGRFVWLVRKGAMTEQCFEEMRAYLIHVVGSGRWSQNWGTRPQTCH